jgi:hypothetical protein
MADTTISGLAVSATSITAPDVFVMDQSGTTKKVPASVLASYVVSTISLTGQPYDLSLSISGAPANNAKVLIFRADRAYQIPINLTGSQAGADTAATASTVFTLYKNGVSIGTITFAASGTTGTFAFAAAVSFAIGDKLTIQNQATADTTLADISITINAVLL